VGSTSSAHSSRFAVPRLNAFASLAFLFLSSFSLLGVRLSFHARLSVTQAAIVLLGSTACRQLIPSWYLGALVFVSAWALSWLLLRVPKPSLLGRLGLTLPSKGPPRSCASRYPPAFGLRRPLTANVSPRTQCPQPHAIHSALRRLRSVCRLQSSLTVRLVARTKGPSGLHVPLISWLTTSLCFGLRSRRSPPPEKPPRTLACPAHLPLVQAKRKQFVLVPPHRAR